MKKIWVVFCVFLIVLVSGCRGTENLPEQTKTCTVFVSCSAVLGKMDTLRPEQREFIPENGVMLAEQEVSFAEGETALEVLTKTLKKEKIHFETEQMVGYDSMYIKAIGNLYEFDCGGNSGWTYTVNGASPDCGADRYVVQEGDSVAWNYITEFIME